MQIERFYRHDCSRLFVIGSDDGSCLSGSWKANDCRLPSTCTIDLLTSSGVRSNLQVGEQNAGAKRRPKIF